MALNPLQDLASEESKSIFSPRSPRVLFTDHLQPAANITEHEETRGERTMSMRWMGMLAWTYLKEAFKDIRANKCLSCSALIAVTIAVSAIVISMSIINELPMINLKGLMIDMHDIDLFLDDSFGGQGRLFNGTKVNSLIKDKLESIGLYRYIQRADEHSPLLITRKISGAGQENKLKTSETAIIIFTNTLSESQNPTIGGNQIIELKPNEVYFSKRFPS
jgi:hypothetical protein